MKKKILIIGSNGYLGRKLVKELKKKHNILEFNYRNSKLDIRKKKDVKKFFKINRNLDYLINLSGQISKDINEMRSINLNGVKNIIQFSEKKTKKIFFSTLLVRKKKIGNEKIKKNYIISKKKMEMLIKKKVDNFNIIRLANVYDDQINKRGLMKELKLHFTKKKKITLKNKSELNFYVHYKDFIKVLNNIIKHYNNRQVITIASEKFTNYQLFNLFKLFSGKNAVRKSELIKRLKKNQLSETKFNILNTIISHG